MKHIRQLKIITVFMLFLFTFSACVRTVKTPAEEPVPKPDLVVEKTSEAKSAGKATTTTGA